LRETVRKTSKFEHQQKARPVMMESDRRPLMNWRVAAAFVAVGTIWGSAWVPIAMLPRTLPGLAIGTFRFAVAAVVLAVPATLFRLRMPTDLRAPLSTLLLPSAILGITMLSLPHALTVWAAGRVSGGLVPLCFALTPLATLIFEGEEQARAIPAVALGIGGVAMLVAPGLSFGLQQTPGAAALLAAMGLGAFSLIYVRKLYARGRLATAKSCSSPPCSSE
jgi:drug/metabolite transporter (DMT)-like permease